jgi:sulfate adenylyltransferase
MPRPHGGKLVDRYIHRKNVEDISKFEINDNLAEDVVNIAKGVFSPLVGFLGKNDLENVITHMRLSDDIPWTIPIILDYDNIYSRNIKEGDTILLTNDNLGIKATMDIEEIYNYEKKILAKEIYGTLDRQHPGVSYISKLKNKLIGGKIFLIENKNRRFDEFNLSPKETRFLFKEKGWRDIVAFQTRNPPHIGHEYVQKTALTFVDGLFINPIIGMKKIGDFKDEVILSSYKTLIKHYYLKNRAVMAILRTSMKYAGPREAIHHSIIRKNYGCTHFIVGRDHAGVGNYYGPYDAHDIFNEFPDLGIIPLFFRSFSKCTKCGSVVNDKICPHNQKNHINFSGKRIRTILQEGKIPSEDMMRKEVAQEILKYKKPFVE